MDGSSPIQTFYLGIPGNMTIAGSMAGTAAATMIGTVSATYAVKMEVFNLTGRNIELVFGADNGTGSYVTAAGVPSIGSNGQIFCPGTASTLAAGRVNGFGVASITKGITIFARTTENTPITCSSVAPFVINLWA